MPRDELRQPLRKLSRRERLWSKRPGALATVAALTFITYVAGGIWLSRIPLPLAGEPVVTAAIPALEEMPTGAIDKVEGAATAADPVEAADAAPAEQPVFQDSTMPQQAEISGQEPDIIVSAQRPMKAAPIAAVSETATEGPLPKVSSAGKRPSEVYAQITPMGVLASNKPKIVLILGGMGLNSRLTDKATVSLPGDVTFGFAPYGEGLQAQVNKARARGHEILLQLPMEPAGYPAINPGPNTLLADASADANLNALHWNMSRFAGYAGVMNYMGGRLLVTPAVLRPVMAEISKRGLLFLQDGGGTGSEAASVGQITGLAMRHSDLVIDADPDAESIGKALKALEVIARAKGVAVGTGTGLEITIDTVNDWAQGLAQRGILLVPVTAAYKAGLG